MSWLASLAKSVAGRFATLVVVVAEYSVRSENTGVPIISEIMVAFSYYSNTLRMTQFKFNVGTQSKYLNGALTWNANGTLSQLALTDQFNSSTHRPAITRSTT